jgi:ubiquinone/menaquinone biosynthesis C-methylase UbiE
MISVCGNTMAASKAFDEIAASYDLIFTNTTIGQTQRRSAWEEIDRNFHAGQRILELNCGTGVDATHLARRGVRVVACDYSPGMIGVARQRAALSEIPVRIDFRVLATEKIGELRNEGPFDGVLSNFSGLNCIADLTLVAQDQAQMVRSGGKAILCLFGRFCLWETVWYLARGDFHRAVRRFAGSTHSARISQRSEVEVWYHSVAKLKKVFSPQFRLVKWKGLGVVVPPSYLSALAQKHSRLSYFASEIDPWVGACPGLRAIADHMLLIFERVER